MWAMVLRDDTTNPPHPKEVSPFAKVITLWVPRRGRTGPWWRSSLAPSWGPPLLSSIPPPPPRPQQRHPPSTRGTTFSWGRKSHLGTVRKNAYIPRHEAAFPGGAEQERPQHPRPSS